MWEKIKRWFKDSEVLFVARLQYYAGLLWLAIETAIEVLRVVDVSPLFTNSKYFAVYMIFSGIVTEIARRRRARSDNLGNLQ